MEHILSARDLVVRNGDEPLTFDVGDGLTMLITGRETGASTTFMALAGRFRPHSGEVSVGGATKTRQRFKVVALAGVTLIDSLERQVDVREVIREQVAWGQHFFKPVPRDILSHDRVEPWLEPLQLADLDVSQDVGNLQVEDRFRLRVLLALVSRPEARLVIVDDIDQIRSDDLRTMLLDDLKALSNHIPVLVGTVNEDYHGQADRVVDIRHGSPTADRADDEAANEGDTGSTKIDLEQVRA